MLAAAPYAIWGVTHRAGRADEPAARAARLWTWRAMVVAAAVVSFSLGPVFRARVRSIFRRANQVDADERAGGSEERIIKNRFVRRADRVKRVVASSLAFVAFIVASTALTLGINYAQARGALGSGLSSVAASAVVIVINLLWKVVCRSLTKLEQHATWSMYRVSNTIKFFLFKLVNGVSLMLATSFVLRDDKCAQPAIRQQLLALFLLDIFVANLQELVTAFARAALGKRLGENNRQADNASLPNFDISNEYLEILYRQFLVFLGLPLVPELAALAAVGNVVEFWLDKYRLLRLTRKPNRLDSSMQRSIVTLLFVAALVAQAAVPFGGGWLLFREEPGLQDVCPLWN